MRRTCAKLMASASVAALLVFSALPGMASEGANTQAVVPTHSFSGAFLAARAAEFDNDLESATAYYERALAYDPDNKGLQQSLLLALVAQGRFDEALPYADKLKEVPEAERFSRLALAVDAFRDENYAKAQDWLQLVLESDFDRLITGVMTAWAKAGENGIEAALAELDSLEGPEWYALFTGYHRALIAAHGGMHDEAVEAFDKLLADVSLGASAPDTYMRAAEAYASYLAQRGETETALAVLDKAEEFISGRASIALLRERLEAGRTVEPVVSAPADGASEVLLNLATALNRGGGESFVRLYLQYALALRPDHDVTLIQLGSVAEKQDDPEEAISLYKRISDNSPWRRIADLQIGLNMADLERQDEAVEHLKTALASDPDDMRAYLALGGVYASQKDFRAAADLYDKAVARIGEPEREHWNIFYQRGIAYERLKEWEKAEPNFHKALELYPDQPQVLNYLGYSWVDMNINLEEGLELIRRAVELRPSDGYIVDSLGWAYYRLGRFEEAVKELERAVSLMPDDPVLNDHLGDAYWRVGRRLEATFQWAHTRDLDPEPEMLAAVEKKLAEGLPPEGEVRLAQAAAGAAKDVMTDETPDGVKATETEKAPTQPAEDSSAYVIKAGQTLWSIAVEQLGDGERFREILELNPDLYGNPDMIRPGQEIRLPQPVE